MLFGGFGEADAIGRNDGGVGQSGIVEIAGNGLFHDELLILERVLRCNQRLLVAGHLALCVHDIEGRHAADLELLLVVLFEAGGLIESALFGLDIFICADQAPVDVLHLIDGVEKLLAEYGVGDTAIVPRLDDEAAVDAGAKPLQKMLGKGEIEAGRKLRAEKTKQTVGGGTRIVEDHLHVRAGDKTLIEGEVVSIGILVNGRQAAGKNRAGLRLHRVIELDGALQCGIEVFRRRPGAIGGKRQSPRTGAGHAGT